MFMILSALVAASAVPPQTEPATKKDNDPIICEGREATEVGTHMKAKRTCLRKSQWEYVHNNTKQELQRINQRGNNPGPAIGRQ